jgi:Superinfection immunity protein
MEFLFIFLVVLYFLPTIIALIRHKYNTKQIILLDWLLGWTVVVWIITLIWAFSKDKRAETHLNKVPQNPDPVQQSLNPTPTSVTISSGGENNPANSTKFCPFCGSKVPADTLICENCGKPIHADPIVLSGNKGKFIRPDEVPLAEFNNVICEKTNNKLVKSVVEQKRMPTMILTDKRLLFLDKHENLNANEGFTTLIYDLSLGETLDKEYWIYRNPSDHTWLEIRSVTIGKALGGGQYLKLDIQRGVATKGFRETASKDSGNPENNQEIISVSEKIYRGGWAIGTRVMAHQINIFLDEAWINQVYKIISSKVNPS